MNNTNALIDTIQRAFAGVTLGKGIGLSEGDAIDDYAPEKVIVLCQKQDERNDWRKIPVELLNKYYVALSYFDAQGMRFHIPAFLIADIQDSFDFDLVFSLVDLEALDNYKMSQFSLLNTAQKRAIGQYLRWVLNNEDRFISAEDRTEIEKALLFWEA